MLLGALPLLPLLFGSNYATALIIRQEGPNAIDVEESALEGTLEWEKITLPSGNAAAVACDSRYGSGMIARSCFEALATGPRGSQQETWVNDGVEPPAGHNIVQLPTMLVGDDTKCILEPIMPPIHQIGHASAWNVTEAARAVIQSCVIRRRIGGVAHYIGGDNRLGVRVMGNGHHAQCSEAIQATPRSCQYILDEMYSDKRLEIFGKGQRRVSVSLPLTLRAPDGLCQVVIDIPSPSSVEATAWYSVWFAISLVNAGCVRQGKGGKKTVQGKDLFGTPIRDMTVTIMDEPAGPALPGNTNSTQRGATSAATA
ncbi:MAG: hypothetical protein Q9211_005100 [Gyalolechia sp. 1 TL-2023]